MGCLHAKRKGERSSELVEQIPDHRQYRVNRNKNADRGSKLFIDLTEKEREIIKLTWWKFRDEPDCRLQILRNFLTSNPTVKKKFQKKNEEHCSNGHLMSAMVSWNIRRFSIRLVEFIDRVVRDVERLDYDDMYEISEVQGARHARLDRMVEPGDMESLTDAIRATVANFYGEKFTRPNIIAWKKLFDVIGARFKYGHARAEKEDKEKPKDGSASGLKFPIHEFIVD